MAFKIPEQKAIATCGSTVEQHANVETSTQGLGQWPCADVCASVQTV